MGLYQDIAPSTISPVKKKKEAKNYFCMQVFQVSMFRS